MNDVDHIPNVHIINDIQQQTLETLLQAETKVNIDIMNQQILLIFFDVNICEIIHSYIGFDVAIKDNNIELLKILINKNNVDSTDEYGDTLLYEAVYYNNIDIIKLLLERGANPLFKCRAGNTPLHLAVEYANKKVLDELISNISLEYDLNQVLNNYKSSLIHSAAWGIREGRNNGWDIIEWLIKDKNMDPFLENDRNKTARDILDILDGSYAAKYDKLLQSLGCYAMTEYMYYLFTS